MAPLYDSFLLFGDSITEHAECQDRGYAWAAALRDAYIRRLEVINRGFSGYNTDMALRVISKAIPPPSESKIRLMTIFFGANDSCFPTESNNQCVPLPQFRINLMRIIDCDQVAVHSAKIILITNPPIDERTQFRLDLEKGYPMRRTSENTKAYADAIKEIGKDRGLPVIDIWSAIMLKAGWEPGSNKPLPGNKDLPPNPVLAEYLFDGLHLSPKGYELLFHLLMTAIGEHYPDQLPEKLPFMLPRWDDGDAWRAAGETGPLTLNRPRPKVTVPDESIHNGEIGKK